MLSSESRDGSTLLSIHHCLVSTPRLLKMHPSDVMQSWIQFKINCAPSVLGRGSIRRYGSFGAMLKLHYILGLNTLKKHNNNTVSNEYPPVKTLCSFNDSITQLSLRRAYQKFLPSFSLPFLFSSITSYS